MPHGPTVAQTASAYVKLQRAERAAAEVPPWRVCLDHAAVAYDTELFGGHADTIGRTAATGTYHGGSAADRAL